MKKRMLRSISLILVLSCLLSATAFSVSAAEGLEANESAAEPYAYVYDESNYDSEFKLGEVVVGLKSDVTASSYEEFFPELDIVEIREVELEVRMLLLLTLREQTRQSVLDAIEILKDDPVVEYAVPNYCVYAIDDIDDIDDVTTTTTALSPAAETGDVIDLTGGIIPNDTYASYLWNIVYTEAFRAWNVTTGSDSVSVGVLDTGIYPVADLADNLDLESGINFINPGTPPIDDNGHGTHVAGIIGAKGNNGIDVAGVCWDVNLVPFKVLGADGYGSIIDITAAISAADEMELPIINMSIQFSENWAPFEDAISTYEGLVVICAGNRGDDLDVETYYPSNFAERYDNVLVVGSTSFYSYNELPSPFTNIGRNSVHLFAPGGFVYSTTPSGVVEMSGTSMAAPHVAGTAALILSVYPECTTEQLIDAITSTVDPLEDLMDIYCITSGRLNVRRALEYFTVRGNGDVDLNGIVNNADLVALGRYLDGLIVLDSDQLLRADANKDNMISYEDIEEIARIIF